MKPSTRTCIQTSKHLTDQKTSDDFEAKLLHLTPSQQPCSSHLNPQWMDLPKSLPTLGGLHCFDDNYTNTFLITSLHQLTLIASTYQ